ncbi:protein ORF106 [Cyprinid herpesvirus 1]|uniref:Protein ORF106 n=1 Tax=Cyprinid herpesvirus 1 TaxID=317858 RepID=K7PC92_9VIRU|nr:protein ORF106 [Cyprinid herpesvirus 1]AFJ20402.1 protein ORF106 [Cyprinid herpesvirus 1]
METQGPATGYEEPEVPMGLLIGLGVGGVVAAAALVGLIAYMVHKAQRAVQVNLLPDSTPTYKNL